METNQFIRELVFGPPKSGKTYGRGSYPKPLLLLNTDPGGWQSIVGPTLEVIESEEFIKRMSAETETWPQVTVLDFSRREVKISPTQFATPDRSMMSEFITCVNKLYEFLPFKTVVMDGWSGLDSITIEFVLALNAKLSMEIQHWGQLHKKKEEVISALLSLPCHVSVIAHEGWDRDEIIGSVRALPLGSGKFQESMGKFFSQMLYSTAIAGSDGKPKFVVYTSPKDLVKCVGMRWPQNRPVICENSWEALYE
jgi:hypothetical protein